MEITWVNGTSGVDQALQGQQKALDKDAFLKLLITELQYQDPMNAMQDKDFIAQLAQFSSLEQMAQITKGFDNLSKVSVATQAFAMIGKSVDYLDPESETPEIPSSGKVDGVTFVEGWPKLNVGSADVDISNILKVY